jgi:hypothetical protein
MSEVTPKLEARDARTIVEDLLERKSGYVPEWRQEPGAPDSAVIQIYARYLQALGERLKAAPDKNKVAFLDLVGISLLPDQPGRAPVVFDLIPDAGNSRAAAGTRLGAQVPGLSDPVLFETEKAIGLAGARLAEAVSLWPARDSWADHSKAASAVQPFEPFQNLQAVPHEIYLAHDTHFALEGMATIELQFELDSPARESLAIAWELWDGESWHGFKPFRLASDSTPRDSLDGTEGLSRSGITRLVSDCVSSEKRIVDGVNEHWVRGRVTQPIPPASTADLPSVDRISIQTVINRYAGELVVEPSTPNSEQIAVEFIGPAGEVFTGTVRVWLDGPSGPLQSFEGEFDSVSWNAMPNGDGLPIGEYRLRVEQPGFPRMEFTFEFDSSALRFNVRQELSGSEPDIAFADGMELDLSKAFYPFGQQPQPGTSFYLSSELFDKTGATITLIAQNAVTPLECAGATQSNPVLIAEYWNGRSWRLLRLIDNDLEGFIAAGGAIMFDVPADMEMTSVNDEEALWVRIRLVSGGYYRRNEIIWDENSIIVIETVPPALSSLAISYEYRPPKAQPQWCFTYNDFQWKDHSQDAAWRGNTFSPFQPVGDVTPALYFGFDKPLPSDLLSMYLDIEEVEGRSQGPALRWEYWDGIDWRNLSVTDETRDLALPGMVEAVWPGVPSPASVPVMTASETTVRLMEARDAARFTPGDRLYIQQDDEGELATVVAVSGRELMLKTPLLEDYDGATIGHASLPRFGTPRTWMRARLREDGDPLQSTIIGVHPNAAWAFQVETVNNEILGGSNEQPGQSFSTRLSPVLPGQVVQVRELEGRRAQVELPILKHVLREHGLSDSDVTVETDPVTGEIDRVWVTWQFRPHLLFSGPEDRHYTVERSRGRIIFGDDKRGRIPPPGADNIRLASYRAGGGSKGNVPAGAIDQLLGAVPLAQGVTNPRAAESGADGEPVEAVRTRGPRVIRHRNQALSLSDYEDLAREASPDVAVARALPTTRKDLPDVTGWVTLVVMPQSADPQPQPTFDLRRLVRRYIAARAPSGMASRLIVTGPTYLPIGVEAVVAPIDPSKAGAVFEDVTTALNAFLHPLTGGPYGRGWPFGRNVYLSDAAVTLESVAGVDYVETLDLLLGGTPRGEYISVPPDRIVVAGSLRVTVTGSED